jgi:hypothetical protein
MSAKFWTDGNTRRQRPDRVNGRAKFRGHQRDEIEAALAAEIQARMEFNQVKSFRTGTVRIRR